MRGAARHAGDAHVECTSGHFAVTVCVVIQNWRWNAGVHPGRGGAKKQGSKTGVQVKTGVENRGGKKTGVQLGVDSTPVLGPPPL